MGTCSTQLLVPTEPHEIAQLPLGQRSSRLKEIATPSGVLRLPLDIDRLTETHRSGPKEIERLFGGASSSSAFRVPAYRCVLQGLPDPARRRCGAKEIERSQSGDPSLSRVLRISTWPKVRERNDSEDKSTKQYVSIADLVTELRSEILRSERIPLKDPILEKACSAYLQRPVRKKKGFRSQFGHFLRTAVYTVLPISCLTGSYDHEADRLE